MKVTFFGNSKYSVIGASIIHDRYGISHIVTIPDRHDKKGNVIYSPTNAFAIEQNIDVFTVNNLDEKAIETILSFNSDFLVVEDYGLILPGKLLDSSKYESLNVHHSLLPKYRGPSPAPAAILAGDKVSGVTIIQMTEKVDAGEILAQEEYTLKPDETTDSLLLVLNAIGGRLVVSVMEDYVKGSVNPKAQDESKASYTKQFTKQDGYFDLSHPPTKEQLDRMIRAYYPWPNVWTKVRIKNLPAPIKSGPAGRQGHESRIKFLPDKKLQVEGGKPMGIKDFLNGYPELKRQVEKLL